jgi:hypothetical protein
MIHDPGDAHEVWIAAQPEHFGVLRIDGIDRGELGLFEGVDNQLRKRELLCP